MPIAGRMENIMKNNTRILIAGGDMRQMFCAARLAEEYDIAVAGFDGDRFPADTELRKADLSRDDRYDCVILPVPPLDENGNVNTPCFSGELALCDVTAHLKNGGVVFTGRQDERLEKTISGCGIINYMEREDLCLKNAVPTAEGAVKLALEELPVTLNGLPVLIVGMGRIGTALAEILKGFGADITAAVRSERAAAKARLIGVKSVRADRLDGSQRLVFNTAPELVFSRDVLEKFGGDTLFIDLASRPGGIDFDGAAELGKKVIWALGLPGKTAPVTAGEIVAETIDGILTERGDTDERKLQRS